MHPEDDNSTEQPSKTRRKQEMLELQKVGARLTGFSEKQLGQLPLTDKLRNALREFNRLPNSHGARRRQLQYIGRLMRDFELREIESSIQQVLNPPTRQATDHSQLLEICNNILQLGDAAIIELQEDYENIDRQALRRFHLAYSKAVRDSADQQQADIRNKLTDYLIDKLE